MEKVLVTGAGGFLGKYIMKDLLKKGYKARGMIEPGHKPPKELVNKAEFVEGDVLDKDSLKKAVKGCQYVIHSAAITSLWPRKSEKIEKVNYQGTKNLIEAVKENRKIKRFVHIGTVSSFVCGTKQDPGNEKNIADSNDYENSYILSKRKAQKLILKETKKGFPAVVCNPSAIFGPGKCANNEIIEFLYNKKLPICPKGTRNFIYVGDASKAIVNSLKKGRIGECYILGNANLTYQEYFKIIGKEIGVQPPKMLVPKILVRAIGNFGELSSIITKKQPKIDSTFTRILNKGMCFSSEKAIKELDLPQTPIRKSVKETFKWMQKEGYMREK